MRPLKSIEINSPDSEKCCLVIFCLYFFLTTLSPCIVRAQDLGRSYETQYSAIYYSSEKDLNSFTRNIGSGFGFFSDDPGKNRMLTQSRVDKIVERVRALLDMYPPDLHFSIYLFQNYDEIENAYKTMGIGGKTPIAFYSHKTGTIYISIRDITDRILAHEIAHVIINFYFGTPPPPKIQEILAQYADKHLWEK